jgi:ATP-dependent Lhr-like helicase
VLSLSTSHSFPLIEVSQYLHSASAADVLVQALLDAPLFGVRWRWNATTALALPRFSGGRKVAPQLQRMRRRGPAGHGVPDQVACAENLVGEREVPDHPLVAQTLHDCLHEAMDLDGWLALLRGLESGAIAISAHDLTGPSPFAAEALNAKPYAFLDDAPLEERRTQAVQSRRYGEADSADDLGRLDEARSRPGARGSLADAARCPRGCIRLCISLALVTGPTRGEPGWRRLQELRARARHALDARWVAPSACRQALRCSRSRDAPADRGAAEFACEPGRRRAAAVEVLRGARGLGPVRAQELAGVWPRARARSMRLLALESEAT